MECTQHMCINPVTVIGSINIFTHMHTHARTLTKNSPQNICRERYSQPCPSSASLLPFLLPPQSTHTHSQKDLLISNRALLRHLETSLFAI